jgi:hypothetical protein
MGTPRGMLFPLSPGRGGPSSINKGTVGTLLLGGQTRAELTASASKGEGTVASRVAPPRIHVVRLPRPVEPVVVLSELAAAAS